MGTSLSHLTPESQLLTNSDPQEEIKEQESELVGVHKRREIHNPPGLSYNAFDEILFSYYKE